MTAKDRFSWDLKCPKCGRAGEGRFWELDGAAFAFGTAEDKKTRVSHLPDGFEAVDAPSRMGQIDVLCSDCRVSAL